jgi:endonuclease YncB( thermonuclease family)
MDIIAIDGDTFRLPSDNIRLYGYNTPEIHGACPAEKQLAFKAKVRLKQLAEEATLTIIPGTCGFERRCGSLAIGDKLVGEILVAEGLAERLYCNGNRCPPRRNWCQK